MIFNIDLKVELSKSKFATVKRLGNELEIKFDDDVKVSAHNNNLVIEAITNWIKKEIDNYANGSVTKYSEDHTFEEWIPELLFMDNLLNETARQKRWTCSGKPYETLTLYLGQCRSTLTRVFPIDVSKDLVKSIALEYSLDTWVSNDLDEMTRYDPVTNNIAELEKEYNDAINFDYSLFGIENTINPNQIRCALGVKNLIDDAKKFHKIYSEHGDKICVW
jgi:ribosomal protein S17E